MYRRSCATAVHVVLLPLTLRPFHQNRFPFFIIFFKATAHHHRGGYVTLDSFVLLEEEERKKHQIEPRRVEDLAHTMDHYGRTVQTFT